MLPVGQVGAAMLVDLVRRQPLSSAKVRFAWEQAAGPALSRATEVTLDAHGTCHVRAVSPAWAREVGRSRDVLLGRLRTMLGSETVSRLVVSGHP
jgi:hypothetical protein